MNSRICLGHVRHRRYVDRYHKFGYRLFMLYLDLAELETVFKPYWLWSVDRFNVAAFRRERYLGSPELPLIDSVKQLIFQRTGNVVSQVMLLTNLTYFGYCFNPLSVYFGLNNAELVNCIAEVSNTPWGERHPYVLTPNRIKHDIYAMQFAKQMHVSPFLGRDYQYQMRCQYQSDRMAIHIENWQRGKKHFDATLQLALQPINHRNLAKALCRHPFMTGKIIAAIYWQALKLWCKGAPITDHEAKLDEPLN